MARSSSIAIADPPLASIRHERPSIVASNNRGNVGGNETASNGAWASLDHLVGATPTTLTTTIIVDSVRYWRSRYRNGEWQNWQLIYSAR